MCLRAWRFAEDGGKLVFFSCAGALGAAQCGARAWGGKKSGEKRVTEAVLHVAICKRLFLF